MTNNLNIIIVEVKQGLQQFKTCTILCNRVFIVCHKIRNKTRTLLRKIILLDTNTLYLQRTPEQQKWIRCKEMKDGGDDQWMQSNKSVDCQIGFQSFTI